MTTRLLNGERVPLHLPGPCPTKDYHVHCSYCGVCQPAWRLHCYQCKGLFARR